MSLRSAFFLVGCGLMLKQVRELILKYQLGMSVPLGSIKSTMEIKLTTPNSEIENSKLFNFMKQVFNDLHLPSGMKGCIRICKQTPVMDSALVDCFFIEFHATADFASYKAEDTYTCNEPDFEDFGKSDFQDFGKDDGADKSCRDRVNQFVQHLKNGTLTPNPKGYKYRT